MVVRHTASPPRGGQQSFREPELVRRLRTALGRHESGSLWAGAALCLISFVLPMAVGAGLGGAEPNAVFRGWRWALYLFSAALGGDWEANFLSLAIRLLGLLVALINPLAVAYVILRVRRKAPGARQRIAIAALVFMALTWIFLAVSWLGPDATRLKLKFGYLCWIAGLILMMGREAILFFTLPEIGPVRVLRPGTPPPPRRMLGRREPPS